MRANREASRVGDGARDGEDVLSIESAICLTVRHIAAAS